MLVGNRRTKVLSQYYGEYIRETWSESKGRTNGQQMLLLEGVTDRPRNIAVTSATRGVHLDSTLCKPYIHRIDSGELDSVIFKGYGEPEFKFKVNRCTSKEQSIRVRYIFQSNKMKTLGEIAYLTGIPTPNFIFRVNPSL